MVSPIKWKKDKENKNTVKIISETGFEVGEIKMTMKITPTRKIPVIGSTLRKLLKPRHSAQ